jgi:hypothetical protein
MIIVPFTYLQEEKDSTLSNTWHLNCYSELNTILSTKDNKVLIEFVRITVYAQFIRIRILSGICLDTVQFMDLTTQTILNRSHC